jgi:hypothetical protein
MEYHDCERINRSVAGKVDREEGGDRMFDWDSIRLGKLFEEEKMNDRITINLVDPVLGCIERQGIENGR